MEEAKTGSEAMDAANCAKTQDMNGNGIQRGPISAKEPAAQSNNNKQELKLAFAALDVDKDGVLSKDEMKAGFKMLGFNVSGHMLDAMFEEADTDGDGVINFTEFCRVMSL
ncbi:calmodulin-like protein 5 [Liolophura sinensis]|uniref:calmodulin-like protein 5 n=1 Tax=Liolophura sinensis TaxID=3198878 RepID=UPI0031581439